MPTKSKPKSSKSLNKKQLAHLEKRLLEERARVMKELGHYGESFNSSLQASDGDLSSYSFHMADQGTDAMEREKAFLFASQEGRYLWHVNQALRRLYQTPEKFGKCEQWASSRSNPMSSPHCSHCSASASSAARTSDSIGSMPCRMPACASSARRRRKMANGADRRLFWGTAGAGVVADVVTKLLAESLLARHLPVQGLGGYVQPRLVYNPVAPVGLRL